MLIVTTRGSLARFPTPYSSSEKFPRDHATVKLGIVEFTVKSWIDVVGGTSRQDHLVGGVPRELMKSIAGGTNAAVQAEGNHLQNRGLIAEDDTSTRYYRESTTLNHLLGAKYLHILL